MASFDPSSALLGGALIGLASTLLMMLTGRDPSDIGGQVRWSEQSSPSPLLG